MKTSSPRSVFLTGTPVPLPKTALWRHVAVGAIGATFGAYTLLGEGKGEGAASLVLTYLLAGAIASLFCGAFLKYLERKERQGLTHRRQLLLVLGCLGSAVLMLAGGLVRRSVRSAQVPFFLDLLAYWIFFALMYGEWEHGTVTALRTRSRLRGLQAQIQPHFFFNTLNTVSALIPEQPAEAQAVIQRLAAIFRTTLSHSDAATVPLDQELDLTREYLEIEKARFGDRIRYSLPAASEARGWQIPALTLQPLVENAVRHGVARLAHGGEVRVILVPEDTGFELQVTNPVEDPRDIDLQHLIREGHSLQLIADRLQLMYNYRARIAAEVDDQFRIRIRIPGRRR